MCTDDVTWAKHGWRPALSRRKRLYRWLSQVFAHWAETADE